MRTKSQRLKKVGRPRIEHVNRTPSGQISREKEPASALALEVRARMTKLTIDKAKNQLAGTWLGRLHMAYQDWVKATERNPDAKRPEASISTAQYYALLNIQAMHNDWLKATGNPGAFYEARGSVSTPTLDEDRARWERSAKARWQTLRDRIQEAQNTNPGNLWAALDICVLQEQVMPHMLGEIRVLGNIVNRMLGKG